MITLQNTSKGIVFAGLMLGIVQTVHTDVDIKLKCVPYLPKWGAITFLTASAIVLFKRKPEATFTQRGELKKLARIDKILSKDYWKNIFHVWYDGFVGQKSSASHLKASDGKIVIEPDVDAQGVMGNLNEYVKPIKEAITTLGAGYCAYRIATMHPSGKSDKPENVRFDLGNILDSHSQPEVALHKH